jgi:hypothetical protein
MGRRQRSASGASIRIDVLADGTIHPQARTYAEYRVFATLTQAARGHTARNARVELRPSNRTGDRESTSCTVTVSFDKDDSVRVRASGAHPCAAINRAVDRLRIATGTDVDRRASR